MKINFALLARLLMQIIVAAPALIAAAKPVIDAAKAPAQDKATGSAG